MTSPKTMQIEHGNFMRLHNLIVEALARMNLSGREFRILLVVLRYTYGFNRKEWVFKNSFFATQTGIDAHNITNLLNVLQTKKLLVIKKHGREKTIGFNKYYKEWKWVEQGTFVEPKDEIVEDKKDGKTEDATPPVNHVLQIKLLWNDLCMEQKDKKVKGFIRIRNIEKPDKKLDSVINKRIIEHGYEMIQRAIENYHKLLMLPKDKTRWRYSWSLYEFLKRDKDNVARFEDWDIVVQNYCDEKKMPAPVAKDMTVSKAMSMLENNRTLSMMQDVLQRMDDEQYIEFKVWLKAQGDKKLIALHNNAIRAGARK